MYSKGISFFLDKINEHTSSFSDSWILVQKSSQQPFVLFAREVLLTTEKSYVIIIKTTTNLQHAISYWGAFMCSQGAQR